jgi:hypothetical protein
MDTTVNEVLDRLREINISIMALAQSQTPGKRPQGTIELSNDADSAAAREAPGRADFLGDRSSQADAASAGEAENMFPG